MKSRKQESHEATKEMLDDTATRQVLSQFDFHNTNMFIGATQHELLKHHTSTCSKIIIEHHHHISWRHLSQDGQQFCRVWTVQCKIQNITKRHDSDTRGQRSVFICSRKKLETRSPVKDVTEQLTRTSWVMIIFFLVNITHVGLEMWF